MNKLKSNLNLIMEGCIGNNDANMSIDNFKAYNRVTVPEVIKKRYTSPSQLAFVNVKGMEEEEEESVGNERDNAIVYMGDGWCTFPDLDNFDSDKLLRAFTLKVNVGLCEPFLFNCIISWL